MISTLVAGIDVLSGSKSPVDAMLRKVLFILSMKNCFCVSFSSPFFPLRGPAPFYEHQQRRIEAVSAPPRLQVEQRCEGEREREGGTGDVMSLVSFLLEMCVSLFSYSPRCSSVSTCDLLPLTVFQFIYNSFIIQRFRFIRMEVMTIQSLEMEEICAMKRLSVCACVCPQYWHSHQFTSLYGFLARNISHVPYKPATGWGHHQSPAARAISVL